MTNKEKKSKAKNIYKQNASDIVALIKRIMIQDGLTQSDVSRVTGINQSFISLILRGEHIPSLKALSRFEAGLGVSFIVIPKTIKRK